MSITTRPTGAARDLRSTVMGDGRLDDWRLMAYNASRHSAMNDEPAAARRQLSGGMKQ